MKELSIEEKVKAYDSMFERLKEMYNNNKTNVAARLVYERYFPELKESEDENIRKALIKYFTLSDDNADYQCCGVHCKDIVTWLEKQGENDRNIKFVTDDAYQRGYDEGIKVTHEKQSEQKPAKNIVETWKDMRLEVYQQASGNRHEPNCSDDTTKMFSLNDIDEIVEKMSEQSPANKVEPKFKKDDWIIHHGTENIYQVVARIDNQYQLKYGDNYTIQNCADVDRCARLWEVAKDAKAGDVLEFGDHGRLVVGIVSYVNKTTGKVDVNCLLENNNFKLGNYYNLDTIKPHPATKEQRDNLEKAMADAGYIFDFEKKELKKINSYCQENCKGFQETGKCFADGDCKAKREAEAKQKSTEWSEDDENTRKNIIKFLKEQNYFDGKANEFKEPYKKEYEWLKSLRPQNRWKPSTFHLECIEDAINLYEKHGINAIGLKEILDELKKLREE